MYLLILIGAGLITFSILTSTLAFRFGTPLLLVFLGIGMLVGEDGLGLVFQNASQANFVGSLALAVILFDAGFGTPAQTLKRAAAPAFVLATVGVLLTTFIVGFAARFLFNIPWLYAMLMGAIISSTDAAAVFFLLRTGGVKIYKRVRSMLEVESSSNDPMAIFLTTLFIEMIKAEAGTNLLLQFLHTLVVQMGMGLVFGVIGGLLLVEIVNRVNLEEALYPILVMSTALIIFSFTAQMGGSGFLAIYVAGIVAGNRSIKGESVLRRYQEGMTWLAQIIMFLTLGLFVTPSEFGPVLIPALLLGLFLIIIGRPIAVVLCLLPFNYDRRTVTFLSWVGLRGAVSILLGIMPSVNGIEGAELFIHVAFVMVVTSLIVQGWTIKSSAYWLKLVVPDEIGPLERIELELPGNPKHELLIYRVLDESQFIKGAIRLPRWARPSLVVREGVSMPPQEAGPLQSGDFVYLFSAPEHMPLLDRLFSTIKPPDLNDKAYFGQFQVNSEAKLVDLLASYDPSAEFAEMTPELTVAEFLEQQLRGKPVTGDRVTIGKLDLIVRRVYQGKTVTEVGLSLLPDTRTPAYMRTYRQATVNVKSSAINVVKNRFNAIFAVFKRLGKNS